MYETSLTELSEEGEYKLKLVGEAVNRGLEDNPNGPSEIATEVLVVASRNPVELAELTADREFLKRAAQITNGKMVELDDLDSLLNSFGSPKETLIENHNVTLWDKWPLLLSFFGFLTTEWLIRRRSGLV